MIVSCEKCGRRYEDVDRWTICPHPGLGDPTAMEKMKMSDETNAAKTTQIRHQAIAAILQFFQFSHLPPHLQDVSRSFCELAERVADGPQNAEATVALRKLLEAKDAAVRAVLFKQ